MSTPRDMRVRPPWPWPWRRDAGVCTRDAQDIIPLRVEGTGFAAKTDEKALKVTKTDVMGF